MNSGFHSVRRWLFRPIFLSLGIAISLAACGSRFNQAALNGQAIFASNCSACHTVGGGNLAGPDLKGITQQQSQQWLINFISNPDQVITSGDPIALKLLREYNYVVMPNMGLTNDQTLAVIAYIEAESALTIITTPASTPGVNLPPGNPENGKAIFLGYTHLRNGAPFCIGCHNIDDVGILGGGTLGPNLTNSYTLYGDAGLQGILSNLPFLTMRPIYANNPITEQEKADLRAFIKSVAGQPQVNKEPLIIAISVSGFLIIMAMFAVVWRNRLGSVRQNLVESARRKN